MLLFDSRSYMAAFSVGFGGILVASVLLCIARAIYVKHMVRTLLLSAIRFSPPRRKKRTQRKKGQPASACCDAFQKKRLEAEVAAMGLTPPPSAASKGLLASTEDSQENWEDVSVETEHPKIQPEVVSCLGIAPKAGRRDDPTVPPLSRPGKDVSFVPGV